jgi:crossover junction endodeoxyribonuclease RuvC
MLIIGIDPGTARTGYGLIRQTSDGTLESVDCGVIETSKSFPLCKRLFRIYQELTGLLSLYHPDCGAVERLFFQHNVKTAISVGEARGVVLMVLAQAEVPVAEYSPNEIKQAVTGYGAASKGQVQAMVKAILNMETTPKPDDAADALAVAICHLHRDQYRQIVETGG